VILGLVRLNRSILAAFYLLLSLFPLQALSAAEQDSTPTSHETESATVPNFDELMTESGRQPINDNLNSLSFPP